MTRQPQQPAEQLMAFFDRELTPAQQAEMEQHLTGNAEANAQLAHLQNLSTQLKSLPQHKLGPDFAAEVLALAERAKLAAVPLNIAAGLGSSSGDGDSHSIDPIEILPLSNRPQFERQWLGLSRSQWLTCGGVAAAVLVAAMLYLPGETNRVTFVTTGTAEVAETPTEPAAPAMLMVAESAPVDGLAGEAAERDLADQKFRAAEMRAGTDQLGVAQDGGKEAGANVNGPLPQPATVQSAPVPQGFAAPRVEAQLQAEGKPQAAATKQMPRDGVRKVDEQTSHQPLAEQIQAKQPTEKSLTERNAEARPAGRPDAPLRKAFTAEAAKAKLDDKAGLKDVDRQAMPAAEPTPLEPRSAANGPVPASAPAAPAAMSNGIAADAVPADKRAMERLRTEKAQSTNLPKPAALELPIQADREREAAGLAGMPAKPSAASPTTAPLAPPAPVAKSNGNQLQPNAAREATTPPSQAPGLAAKPTLPSNFGRPMSRLPDQQRGLAADANRQQNLRAIRGTPVASGDVLVVEVEIPLHAVQGGALDQVLGDCQIGWAAGGPERPDLALTERGDIVGNGKLAAKMPGAGEAKGGGKAENAANADAAQDQPQEAGSRKLNGLALRNARRKVEVPEAMVIEATPAQVGALLQNLSARTESFRSLQVAHSQLVPMPDSPAPNKSVDHLKTSELQTAAESEHAKVNAAETVRRGVPETAGDGQLKGQGGAAPAANVGAAKKEQAETDRKLPATRPGAGYAANGLQPAWLAGQGASAGKCWRVNLSPADFDRLRAHADENVKGEPSRALAFFADQIKQLAEHSVASAKRAVEHNMHDGFFGQAAVGDERLVEAGKPRAAAEGGGGGAGGVTAFGAANPGLQAAGSPAADPQATEQPANTLQPTALQPAMAATAPAPAAIAPAPVDSHFKAPRATNRALSSDDARKDEARKETGAGTQKVIILIRVQGN